MVILHFFVLRTLCGLHGSKDGNGILHVLRRLDDQISLCVWFRPGFDVGPYLGLNRLGPSRSGIRWVSTYSLY